MSRKPNSPSAEHVRRSLNCLLEGWYPMPGLRKGGYSRRQDDTDGLRGPDQNLTLVITNDGDVWIPPCCGPTPSLRFRGPFGGGQSERVHKALLILAEAIRRDNEERPQSASSAGEQA